MNSSNRASDFPFILFLNGPREVGKSSVAVRLASKFPGRTHIIAHADPLAWATSEMFWSGGDMVAPLKDSEVKRGPLPGFDHVQHPEGILEPPKYIYHAEHVTLENMPPVRTYTVRDWLIALGHFTRAQLGPDALSRILLRRMVENEAFVKLFIVEGCRTSEDIETIVEHYGPQCCLVVRLFREGHSFEGDLGYYIPPEKYPAVEFLDLHNNGTLEEVVDVLVEKLNAKL